MLAVQGAYHYGELEDGYHVRVIFKCPHCGRRHKQLTKGKDTALDGVDVEAKCGMGTVRVVPYRSLE
jgi:hypothetical protein